VRERIGRARLGARSRTENYSRLSTRDVEASRVRLRVLGDSDMPRTRGECVGGARPCPFVSCQHNLFLDVNETGSIKFNFPDLDPEDVPPAQSCVLDVADFGGSTLDDVARTMNVSRERARQMESHAIDTLRRRSAHPGAAASALEEFSDAPPGTPPRRTAEDSVFGHAEIEAAVDEEPDAEEPPTRISFFADPDSEAIDAEVTDSVWNMFARDSNGRGFDCRSRQQRSASKAMAERWADRRLAADDAAEETPMTKTTSNISDRAATVLDAYQALETKLGRLPSNQEIADHIAAPWSSEQTVRAVRKELVEHGLAETRPRGGHLGTPLKVARAPRVGPGVAKTQPALAVKHTFAVEVDAETFSPVVAELAAKRDKLLAVVDAINVTIAELSR
jgi:hypothetical protein